MEDGPLDWNYSYPRVCVLQHLFGGCPASCNAPEVPTFLRPTPERLTPQVCVCIVLIDWLCRRNRHG